MKITAIKTSVLEVPNGPPVSAYYAANTYVVAGTNFPTGSTLQTATLGGINANSGVIDSATQVTLTFANGIGFGNDLPLSALVFADGKRTKIDAAAKITVAFTATLAQNVACSYAGGCLY